MRAVLLLCFCLSCSQWRGWEVKSPEREVDFFHLVWAKNLDFNYQPGNLPVSYGGVATSEDSLYVGALDGSFRAVDVENGRELWGFKESRPVVSTPLIVEGLVYYGTQGGRLIARDTTTGEMRYAIDLGGPIESAPVYAQGRLVVYLRGHQVVCLDAQTGKIVWNYRRAVPVTVTLQRSTRPLIVGEKIFIGFADGFAGALSLQEGTLLWEQKLVETQKFVDVDINPILFDGLVVTGSPSGELKGLDPVDGSIRRHYPVKALTHPLARENALIYGTSEGEILFLDKMGRVLKEKKVSRHPLNQLWWWKDHLIASTFGGELLAIDPLSLTVRDHFLLGHQHSTVFGEGSLGAGGLGILSSRSRVYFFK